MTNIRALRQFFSVSSFNSGNHIEIIPILLEKKNKNNKIPCVHEIKINRCNLKSFSRILF